ncbi:hypothetical protein ACHHYP_11652 [Achlya hypogyna]|uniref:Uncharacterized protein n=1 Tax=Achlya hypogyna TaxID=1202772 RepID=A0A1V9YIP5_ACHHY|nr:hypothetical protein ACHHYP_11652 [Achlya hypogyna]
MATTPLLRNFLDMRQHIESTDDLLARQRANDLHHVRRLQADLYRLGGYTPAVQQLARMKFRKQEMQYRATMPHALRHAPDGANPH